MALGVRTAGTVPDDGAQNHWSAHHILKNELRAGSVIWMDPPKVSCCSSLPGLTDSFRVLTPVKNLGMPTKLIERRMFRSASSGSSWSMKMSQDFSTELPPAPGSRRGITPSADESRYLRASLQSHQALMESQELNVYDDLSIRSNFLEILRRKYGSIVNAWRMLDPNRHGRICYYDICRASERLGMACNTQILWNALDTDKDGFVRLQDIDPESANLLRGFVAAIVKAIPKSAKTSAPAEFIWRKYFSNGNEYVRCSLARFGPGAKKMGYRGDADAVFAVLNAESILSGICFPDFCLLDKWFSEA